eukprot:CAMPEP_0178465154 /NCGR_PEP_ID=MMETSP0689_2-20121128/51211_1 /TAXON_ID=160604 /ORGANISM="Amphidinium massartii, Strain CS-259" /LENGTH=125 /DNA_ID=CAMNT_0020092077 /DNA_START=32 /DNA_END=409 /DNA_ORIENTATION=+
MANEIDKSRVERRYHHLRSLNCHQRGVRGSDHEAQRPGGVILIPKPLPHRRVERQGDLVSSFHLWQIRCDDEQQRSDPSLRSRIHGVESAQADANTDGRNDHTELGSEARIHNGGLLHHHCFGIR